MNNQDNRQDNEEWTSPFLNLQPQARLNLPFGLHEPLGITMIGIPPEPFRLVEKLGLIETLGHELKIKVHDLVDQCSDSELYRAPFYARHWTDVIANILVSRKNPVWLYYAGRDWLDWMPIADVIRGLADTKDTLFILLAYRTYTKERVDILMNALSRVGMGVKETQDGPKIYQIDGKKEAQ